MTTSLAELNRLAADARTPDERVRHLLAALERLSGLDAVFLARVDCANDRFELLYAHNAETSRRPVTEGLAIPWTETTCKHALAEGLPSTHTADDRWPDLEVVHELNITTYAFEPIRDAAGTVVGTLCAISDRRKPLSTPTRRALQQVAMLVAPQLGGSRTATAAGTMDELAAQAAQDPMTGLPTRAALLDTLVGLLRDGARVGVAMVDLIGFEAIDDRDGHWGADQFLFAASRRLVDATVETPGAAVARFGDREFAVVVRLPPDADAAGEMEALGARLAAATRGAYEIAWSQMDYDGAAVSGVVAAPGEDARDLLGRAEEAMLARRRA